MSLSLKDKWRNSLLKSFDSKRQMDKSLVSYLNHRDIFDVADLKNTLSSVQNLPYDKNPAISMMNAKNNK